MDKWNLDTYFYILLNNNNATISAQDQDFPTKTKLQSLHLINARKFCLNKPHHIYSTVNADITNRLWKLCWKSYYFIPYWMYLYRCLSITRWKSQLFIRTRETNITIQ